jgi:DNA helicase-2/ATP-dependent DNA helicase PcrA
VEPTIDDILAALDERQRRAATLPDGPIQLIAPAGSGKTATLVARIGVLIARGVPAVRILVVTFNRDAAGELARRITARLGVIPGRGGPEVRTLHALARRIALDGPDPPRLVADRLPLVRRARREVLGGLPAGEVLPPAEELDGVLSAAVLEGRTHPSPLDRVVEAYQRLLAAGGWTDFDGLLARALARLRADEALRHRWQERFSHVLVDEYQDVDGTQVELVSLLAQPERNLFVVGDDDQTIYAWRLADVRRILEFPVRFPDAERIVLETNYRCPPAVVAAADRLIAVNRERVPKRLRAAPRAEAEAESRPIATWPVRGPDWATRLMAAVAGWAADGTRVAVLARTRSELAPLLLACLRAGVPHATSVPGALLGAEVQTLLGDLHRVDPATRPLPGLLAARAERGWRRGDPSDALGEEAHAGLDAVIGWSLAYRRTDAFVADAATAARQIETLRDPAALLELATVHGAKGREWPTVVVLGLEVDRFPNQRALEDAIDPRRALEEERRLAYVAVTRARERLILAFDPDRPSPFVTELMGRPRHRSAYRPTSAATVSR